MQHNIHAFTEQSNDYPAYISINRDETGKHTVTVRSRGDGGRNVATIELTPQQLEALATDVGRNVATIELTPQQLEALATDVVADVCRE